MKNFPQSRQAGMQRFLCLGHNPKSINLCPICPHQCNDSKDCDAKYKQNTPLESQESTRILKTETFSPIQDRYSVCGSLIIPNVPALCLLHILPKNRHLSFSSRALMRKVLHHHAFCGRGQTGIPMHFASDRFLNDDNLRRLATRTSKLMINSTLFPRPTRHSPPLPSSFFFFCFHDAAVV
ncbi:hypothetical protein DM01DRAFT_1192737 [Hesseltinella vesiculosa]|uniref:Uncharacterized protein n=1 Tax=Hesseltinella vesiculosa TaxID=101127 RepID=A0A1X2GRQ2_9FUNG|nr:hypothetical protein DM01DRAFT_1192737 [Hesseltinella vesiculosa]